VKLAIGPPNWRIAGAASLLLRSTEYRPQAAVQLGPPTMPRAAARAYDRAMPAQRRAAGIGPRFLQVQTTTDSRAEAVELAQSAVEARLAACAQVTGPIASTYWWEDGLEKAEEWLIMLKLPAERFDDLAEFLTERHSYDDPEIIATPIVAGSQSYLDWIAEETQAQ
jgi:periplasmic divalent cation tolerance protein